MRQICVNYRRAYIGVLVLMLFLSGCDVHEFPDVPDNVSYKVKLVYEFDNMYDWKPMSDVIEEDSTAQGQIMQGVMRYVIRLYPRLQCALSSNGFSREYVLYGSVYDVYGTEFTLDLPSGDYNMMVWADFVNPFKDGRTFFYDADDFAEIRLVGHVPNTDYRDAFRGDKDVCVEADIDEREPRTIEVRMTRPLAKFEFVSNDLKEFLQKESRAAVDGLDTKAVEDYYASLDLSDYNVVFYYTGYMPDTYSMFTDKAVDAVAGSSFKSVIRRIKEGNVSLGFDYVFVNGEESSVSIQVGVYNADGRQLAMSRNVVVPLRRGHHTVIRGAFLTDNVEGGLAVNPEFEGEHIVIIP